MATQVLDFGARRRGKSTLPQDQIAKRNEFDERARLIACLLRRAELDWNSADLSVHVTLKTDAEAAKFAELMLALQKRRLRDAKARTAEPKK